MVANVSQAQCAKILGVFAARRAHLGADYPAQQWVKDAIAHVAGDKAVIAR
jgi:hypothetical protein